LGAGLAACSTEPKKESDKASLSSDVDAALTRFRNDDSSLNSFLNNSYGYAVFPDVGKGGFIVGGSYGRGEVFERGVRVGYADITQATVGLQAGAQTFSELLVFENKEAMDRFKSGKLAFAANASAVAIKSGAAASARYADGVAVFVRTTGGLMAEAALGGQQFTYKPY
jgi:lipid-binding SYLF domain-containing protein